MHSSLQKYGPGLWCGLVDVKQPTTMRPAPGRVPQLVLNQVGYDPAWPKVALLLNAGEPTGQPVELVDADRASTVLVLTPGPRVKDAASVDIVQALDFTAFRHAGRYFLRYGAVRSYPFQIGTAIYTAPLATMLRSYYLQRCGIAVDDQVTGIHHPACHVQDGVVAHTDVVHRAGERLLAQGGWHDAGDFGKYVATTTVTIGRLLSLYEQHPHAFSDGQLHIPESGNGSPDLLDEVKVGLAWLLTMQRADGAVYRKLSGAQWPAPMTPEADTQRRFVYGISTPETAKFAAAMAMAARIYLAYDADWAQQCLQAAWRAWQFLRAVPSMQADVLRGDDSGSGPYMGSDVDPDETLRLDVHDRLWAAAELWITTGQAEFQQYVAAQSPRLAFLPFAWPAPSTLGMMDALWHRQRGDLDPWAQQVQHKLLQRADGLLDKIAQSGYRLANDCFVWGSNKMTAEEGITLLYAYRLTGKPAYFQGAVDQLDYLLGRNHFHQSFVSGVGANPVRHINHLLARAAGLDIPGLLVGGPNEQAPAGIAPKGRGPLSYVDDARAYDTNENAIDYNASLIALLGLLMHTPYEPKE